VNGLSPDTDVSALTGCTLTFVGFDQHQVQLAFYGHMHCAISIEGDYVVTPAGQESSRFSDAVAGASALLPLLGRAVTLAAVPSDGTVQVVFDDGSVVAVLDSEADYESYQIHLGDRLLVV
jgi:hypothetical protein